MHAVRRLLVVLSMVGLCVGVAPDVSSAAVAPPVVSTVVGASAATGPTAGGNTVTITGTGFTKLTKVTFGTTPGTTLTVTSTTKLTVKAPAHTAGTVDIRITGTYGTSTITTHDHYTYVAPPVVSTVVGASAATGPTAGGNTVTITGTGFTKLTKVTFGTTPGTTLTVTSTTKLTVKAPAHTAGTVDIRITGTYGTSTITTHDHYTYVAPPVVSTVVGASAATGPTAGGNTVTITGTGFTKLTKVTFGTTPGTTLTVTSTTKLTVKAPAHTAGTVDIRITGTYGTSTITTHDHYTYVAPPVVTAVAPMSGTTAGGTTVTVTGNSLVKILSVKFGTTAGTGLTQVSPTHLTVTAPAHTAGLVNVTVIGTYGTSAVVTADHYTYVTPLTVTTTAPPAGEVNVPYLVQLKASHGTAPYSWATSGGSLPPGVTLDRFGVLQGTPTAAGTSTVSVTVTDHAGRTAAATLTIPVVAANDWTQSGHDNTSSHNASGEDAITSANVTGLRLEWSQKAPTLDLLTEPAVANGVVYEISRTTTGLAAIDAYSLHSGVLRWRVIANCVSGPLAVTPTLLLTPCGGGLSAYSLTGDHPLLWNTAITDTVTAPDLSGLSVLADRVILDNGDNVAAYALGDGHRLWRQLMPSGAFGRGLAEANAIAIVPMDDRVRAFNTTTGGLLWTVMGSVDSAAISGSTLLTDLGGQLTALRLDTGAQLWSTHLPTATTVRQVLAVDDQHAYVVQDTYNGGCLGSGLDDEWALASYSVANGTKQWETDDVPERPHGATITHGLLWINTYEFTIACDGREGSFQAYSLQTGALVRDMGSPLGGIEVLNAPVAADGVLVIAQEGALQVYGFGPPQPAIGAKILPTAWVGSTYSASLAAGAGTAPYTWSIASGNLPAGLALSASGTITGTSTAATEATVTVQVSDGAGRTATRTLTVSARAAGSDDWDTDGYDTARTGLAPDEDAINLDTYAQVGPAWSSNSPDLPFDSEIAVHGTRVYAVGTTTVTVGTGDGAFQTSAAQVFVYDIQGSGTTRDPILTMTADPGSSPNGGVTIAGNNVLLPTTTGVYAFNLTTGAKLWFSDLVAPNGDWKMHSSTLVAGSLVFLDGVARGTSDDVVEAIHLSDGSAAWAQPYQPATLGTDDSGFSGSMASDGAKVYVNHGCHVFALNATSGALAWKKPLTATGLDNCDGGYWTDGSTSPIVDGGVLFDGARGSTIAFTASNGSRLWTDTIGPSGNMALSNGALVISQFLPSSDGISPELSMPTALDAHTGETIWTDTALYGQWLQPISISGDIAWAGDTNGRVAGVSLVDGGSVWLSDNTSGSGTLYPGFTAVAPVAGSLVFVGWDGQVHAYAVP